MAGESFDPDLDVVLLPERQDGDFGYYPDTYIELAKELRAGGLRAGFMHDPEHRKWIGRKGVPVAEVVALGVVSSVLGAGLVAALRKALGVLSGDRVRLKVMKIKDDRSGLTHESFEWDGSKDGVVEALHEFIQDDDKGS